MLTSRRASASLPLPAVSGLLHDDAPSSMPAALSASCTALARFLPVLRLRFVAGWIVVAGDHYFAGGVAFKNSNGFMVSPASLGRSFYHIKEQLRCRRIAAARAGSAAGVGAAWRHGWRRLDDGRTRRSRGAIESQP
jgi:hypothetical protein